MVGVIAPALPYMTFIFSADSNFSEKWLDVLFDPLNQPVSLYGAPSVNPHSQWRCFFGFSEDELSGMQVPFIFNMIFISGVNAMVILSSRSNKLMGSHKKHLLQLLCILQITFYLGSPKIAAFRGVMGLILLLQLILYSEFNSVALIYGIAVHSTDMDRYMAEGHTAFYFFVYFVHFWGIALILRSFVNVCFNKQAGVAGTEVTASNDEEETARKEEYKKMRNAAFKV